MQKNNRCRLLIAFLCSILLASGALPSVAEESSGQGCEAAEKSLSRVEAGKKPRWSVQLYEIFETHRSCLEGDLGEAYTSQLTHLMVKDPEGIPALMRLMNDDRAFHADVLDRISGEVSNNDLKRIARNAETYCPPKAIHSCHAVAAKAQDAMIGQASLTEEPSALEPPPPVVEEFPAFWKRFREAALADDMNALAELTRFPFLEKGVIPGTKTVKHSKESFLGLGDRLMKADAGNGVSTMRQLIEVRFPGDVADLAGEKENVQVGSFEFERTPTGWQFTAAYLTQ